MEATLEKDPVGTSNPDKTQDEALLDIYRKLRPGEPPTIEAGRTLLDNFYFNPKRYDLAKVGRYKVNKKLGLDLRARPEHAADRGHRGHDRVPVPAARRRGLLRDRAGDQAGRARRHRPLRQPPPAHRRRADPEPAAHRAVPDGARGPRADDHPGRRGDHAADPDQHPAGGRLHQGVLRHLAALPVPRPDQPGVRPDAQAPPVRARPRRPVPRAGRLRGPRRAPVALRPDVPDRDPRGSEHRPDRLAVHLCAGQRVRVHRDAVPQGRRRGPRQRRGALPHRRRGGPARHRAGQRAADVRRVLRRAARPGPHQGRRGRLHRPGPTWTTWTSRRARWCRWPRQ